MTTFIGTTTAYTDAGTSVSPTLPTGTADDDIMFALVYANNGISSAPSGWTSLGNDSTTKFYLYYKLASSETGPYQWSQGSSGKMRAQVVIYRGDFDTSDPIDAVSNTDYTTSNTTLRAATFSVTNTNSTIIFAGILYGFFASVTISPPTNPGTFTEDVDDGDSSSDSYLEFAHYTWSSNGSTGNIDATSSQSSAVKHAFAVSLNPAKNDITFDPEIDGFEFSSSVTQTNNSTFDPEIDGFEFSSTVEYNNNVSFDPEIDGFEFSSTVETVNTNNVTQTDLELSGSLLFSSVVMATVNVSSFDLQIKGLKSNFRAYSYVDNVIMDLANNPILAGTSGDFLGYIETVSSEILPLRMYDFLLYSIRQADASREGAYFVKRFLEGPQKVWESTQEKIFALKDLWSVTKCPNEALKYLKCIVGWTSELDYITNELDYATLRRLIATSIPLWRKRGQEETTLDILTLAANSRCVIWNWFDYRWIIDETEFSELHQGRDSWIINSGDGLGEYYSNLRIVDDGTLNRNLVENIIKLMRPCGERIEISYIDFIDRFLVEDDTSQWKTEQGELLISENGNGILNDNAYQLSIVDVANSPAWNRYVFYCRIKGVGTGNSYGIVFYYVDSDNYYELQFNIDSVSYDYVFNKIISGVATTIISGNITQKILNDTWYGIRTHVDVDGSYNRIKFYINGNEIFNVTDASTLENGTIGFFSSASATVKLDECELFQIPLETELININS